MQTAIPLSISTNPLEAYLRRLIERHGPITVAEYMALALGHPDYGYYQTRDPFGRGGDFVTAPEISQMFGEMIGAWCIDRWRAMGNGAFNLVEFGPGRGTLLRDLLRVAGKIAPDFVAAMRLHLVETSPVLRDLQAEALAAYQPRFHAGIEDVPEGPALYIMNEFLDALPVRQFIVTESGLCERRVGLVEGKFAFVVEKEAKLPFSVKAQSGSISSPAGRGCEAWPVAGLAKQGEGISSQPVKQKSPHPVSLSPERLRETCPLPAGEEINAIALLQRRGKIIETCPAAIAITREIAARIAQHGGAALIIDYGYDAPAGEDTFQAVRNHEYANVLEDPGEADLTAHVDFSALATAARAEGVVVQGPVGQGEFLRGLGIDHRAQKLIAAGDKNAASALHRLTADDQMGMLFKVLILEGEKDE